jgi:hypothetical protein
MMGQARKVLRIGEILVEHGAISSDERDVILEHQRQHGRPFGDLAERLFGVRPEVVEEAWARQYALLADHVDPARLRPTLPALALVSRRQARQFGVLPVELDTFEVMLCTSESNLARALRFAAWKIGMPAYFVLAEEDALKAAIERVYARGSEAA